MPKFQLHPTTCDKHKEVEITYDAAVYTECPMCKFDCGDYDYLIDDLRRQVSKLEDMVDDLEWESQFQGSYNRNA